jgi:hypothetical protein
MTAAALTENGLFHDVSVRESHFDRMLVIVYFIYDLWDGAVREDDVAVVAQDGLEGEGAGTGEVRGGGGRGRVRHMILALKVHVGPLDDQSSF